MKLRTISEPGGDDMNGFGGSNNAATLGEASASRLPVRIFQALAALVVLSVGISIAGAWFGRSVALVGHSDSTQTREVVIGNNVLIVPDNVMRFEKARVDGETDRLDLYFRWPDMAGYTREAQDEFNNRDGRRTIIFAGIEQMMMSRDMSGRLEPIYKHVIVSRPEKGPANLAAFRFKPNSGYSNEVLMVGAMPGGKMFVARCLDGPAAQESLAPCERDVQFADGLSVSYRFPEALLASWRDLDGAVMGRVAGFVPKSR